jgi:hypothetical protein
MYLTLSEQLLNSSNREQEKARLRLLGIVYRKPTTHFSPLSWNEEVRGRGMWRLQDLMFNYIRGKSMDDGNNMRNLRVSELFLSGGIMLDFGTFKF